MISEKDVEQIEFQGLTINDIDKQLKYFRQGFSTLKLIGPATADNGIKILSEEEENRLVSIFENSLSTGITALKFVPASGAASRMFKNLFSFLEKATTDEEAERIAEEDEFMKQFFTNIEKFAFYNNLIKITENSNNKIEIVKTLLSSEGLNYGQLPKGQLSFHKYIKSARTPFEEHLVEAASYCAGSNGLSRVHFTVPPEHQEKFEQLYNKIKVEYQKRFGVQFEVTFSHQHKSTDTIAVDSNNEPFRDDQGNLIFRPGGHGALIENLNELDADIIFIKNIDNVVPDYLKAETKRYKKILAGLLVTIRNKTHAFLDKLDKIGSSENTELFKSIDSFLRKELNIHYDNNFITVEDKIEFYKKKLNRPIRICGMVKNEGESGGGPFYAINPDKTISLQIVEKDQIDINNDAQFDILSRSTHFNPVDIICSFKDYKGKKFDLLMFRDSETGFISSKSFGGKEIKALELPGLWNGAMSDWNTIFVEVPAETFNPVKTINDLLKTEHQ